jgi:DeoR family transcriptional regulator, aga operon transcriptional repressor
MIKAERHDRILNELVKNGAVGVQQIAALLDVSEATVRRDLSELDEKKLVLRSHGGAAMRDGHDELPYQSKITAHLAEKRRIGAKAASLVQPNQVIGCSGGTTMTQVIKALRDKPLRIVTNAVNLAMELVHAPEVEVLITGGIFRSRTYELVGHVSERTLKDVYLDIAIIGVDGMSLKHGLTTYDNAEAYACRSIIERASQVWVVADHSKLEQVRPAIISPIERVHRLITDTNASSKLTELYKKKGIELILA